jgi:hypothetical protein
MSGRSSVSSKRHKTRSEPQLPEIYRGMKPEDEVLLNAT